MRLSLNKQVTGVFILSLLLARAAFAEPSAMGEPESTVKMASVKLCRGLVNTLTGIGEILRQPVVCTMDDGASGVPVGLVNGVFMAFVRTGAGLLEVVTFPIPLDSSIEYRSLLDPEYVWQRTSQ